MVFRSSDGSDFTDEQSAAISDLLVEVEGVDGVDAIMDPFTTEQSTEDQQAALEQGRSDLASGLAEVADGQQEIGIERAAAMLALIGDYPSVSEDSSAAIGMVMFEVPAMDLPAETKDSIVATLLDADIEGVNVLPSLDLSTIVPDIATGSNHRLLGG